MNKFLSNLFLTSLLLTSCNNAPIKQYSVSLDPNGGVISETEIKLNEGSKGSDLPVPTKEGKEFLGWFTGWGVDDIKIEDNTLIDKDYSLIAKWDKYDISYLNKDNTVFTTETVKHGEYALGSKTFPEKVLVESDYYYLKDWNFDFDTIVRQDYQVNGNWVKDVVYHTTIDETTMFEGKNYFVPVTYMDSYLNVNSNVFSKDLAVSAFGIALCTESSELATKVYQDLGFSDLYISPSYEKENKDAASVVIGHKKVNDDDIILISIRSYLYDQEWANNFKVGLEGDHQGFDESSDKIIADLRNYVSNKNYSKEHTKILVDGYSRGGALAQFVGVKLNKSLEFATKDNIFTYSFESPKGFVEENDFDNIFNIYNSSDPIANVLPTQYGFYHAGKSIDIYTEKVEQYWSRYIGEFTFPSFAPTKDYETEKAAIEYVINKLVSYDTKKDLSLRNREELVNNYQSTLMYVFDFVFSLKRETLSKIMDDLEEKGAAGIISMLTVDSFYKYIKPFIDEDGISYNEEELKGHLQVVINFIMGPVITGFASFLLQESGLDFFKRIALNHFPETNYVMLKRYVKKGN